MLTILKSKRLITSTELANRFDVSVRTIYRDLKKLEESGVPIMCIEGRGYSLMDGYSVAPIMFDEMEVNALITAEQLIAKTNDDSLIKHFEQTLEKIKSVFRSNLQSQGELLQSKMRVFKQVSEEGKSASLTYLQLAITNFKVTEITYQTPAKSTTLRRIEPLAIYSLNDKWLIIGWCRLRQDYRVFRLDRIQHFNILEETFEDRNFDLRNYFMYCEQIESNP
ncbi:MAG: WYL domain-containing protein [Fulvivirga sp.]